MPKVRKQGTSLDSFRLSAFCHIEGLDHKDQDIFSVKPLCVLLVIENLKQCSYLKCPYLKMGSHGIALAVSFFRRRACLRSRAHDFHYSIEKRCGKLGRSVSFSEIHAL